MSWIAAWLAAHLFENKSYKGIGFVDGVYMLAYDSRTRRVVSLRKLCIARQERDAARAKILQMEHDQRAAYNKLYAELHDKLNSDNIALKQLAQARERITALQDELDTLRSRLGAVRLGAIEK